MEGEVRESRKVGSLVFVCVDRKEVRFRVWLTEMHVRVELMKNIQIQHSHT